MSISFCPDAVHYPSSPVDLDLEEDAGTDNDDEDLDDLDDLDDEDLWDDDDLDDELEELDDEDDEDLWEDEPEDPEPVNDNTVFWQGGVLQS